MPKRKAETDDKPAKKPTVRLSWSAEEEALFLNAVNEIVSKQIWASVKDTELAARQNGGVMSHWKMMYRKLVKEYAKE
ncbi:hypothetical protein CcaverHIS002_0700980 [Cutaneotrichosporon cavernicola]|nr:hypothetical protein CcaverHIS002_0700980 [Cutaneotrichosporon cavernicola]